jgi:hypothetical protein
MTVAQVDKVPALPSSFKKPAAAVAEDEAPVKRAPKASEKPVVKQDDDVDDILDNWDNE